MGRRFASVDWGAVCLAAERRHELAERDTMSS